MRLIQLFSWLLLCGSLAFVMPAQAQTSSGPGRVAGRIVAAKVTGTVTATNAGDNSQRTLATGDAVTQQTVITTGAGSSVILIFSNGASLNLGAETTLSIDEFLQDPFATDINVSDLKAEPTSSTTRLSLSRGELVGNVKKLNQDAGSSFTVNTPVGAAGIRGTTFRIVFRPDSSGKVFFTLSTAEGQVLFKAPAAEGVSVDTGKEVVVNVDVTIDTATGTVTVTSPIEVQAPRDMPAETQASIAVTAQEIVEAQAALVIKSVTDPVSSTPAGPPETSEQKSEDTTDPETTSQFFPPKPPQRTSNFDGVEP